MRGPSSVLAPLSIVLIGAACAQLTRRVPGPIGVARPSAGAAPLAGRAEEYPAVVQRDSDPVWVRRPGERGDYGLPFYRKRERIAPGSQVRTGAGGRAEILWSGDATAVILFEQGFLRLGDPELDEPQVTLTALTRALVHMTPEDRFALPGGALLRGDPAQPTGPLLFEAIRPDLLRVVNQSKLMVRISYRDLELDLAAGESIDLPLLPAGTAPLAAEPEPVRLGANVLSATLAGGRAEHEDFEGGLRVRAVEEAELAAFGLSVRLAAGEQAEFTLPGARAPAAGADVAPR